MRKAFTLLELLVVIAIITVLLAMLVPALDKAIYQAELAACGAQLKGLTQGITMYAMEHKRFFPPRIEVAGKPPDLLANPTGGAADMRPPLKEYFSMSMYRDPLSPKIAYDSVPNGTELYSTYKFWHNWKYKDEQRSSKLGVPFTWDERAHLVLVSDYDEYYPTNNLIASNHPDRDGFLAEEKLDAENIQELPLLGIGTGESAYRSRSRWQGTPFNRSMVDLNFAEHDNSVYRVSDLIVNDGNRMERIPNEYLGDTDNFWYNRVKE